MNVFVIPSWYPNSINVNSGIFIKEQSIALSKFDLGLNIFVSCWGHMDSEVSVWNPFDWYRKIIWYLKEEKNQIIGSDRFYEIYNPQIHSYHDFFFGGIKQLIDVNRKNFKLASSQFGNINIIHAHVAYPAGYIAMKLAKEFDIPYIITEHMSPFPFQHLIKNGLPIHEINLALKNANSIVTVSPSLSDKIFSLGYSKPVVIPNMIDDSMFKVVKKERRKKVFLTVAGLINQKGIDLLLAAIKIWDPSPNDIKFVIIGDGPMRSIYKNLSNSLGLNNLIHWKGAVERKKIPYFFNNCDAFILPSRHESFGVVCAEAIASGKPIIVTKCGGPEYIVNKTNGILVDANDIAQLSLAIKNMFLNIGEYDSYEIRQDFERRFSPNIICLKIFEVYNQVIDQFENN